MKNEIFYNNNKLNRNKIKETWIKKHYPIDYELILKFNSKLITKNFSQKLYNYMNNIIILYCEHCGDEHSNYINYEKGYSNFCSKSCASKHSSKQGLKTRELNTIEKCGIKHTSQLDDTKMKMKQTNLERYGVEYPSQNEEIKEKIEKTTIQNYGVKRPIQNREIKEKIEKTMFERYGEKNISKSNYYINKTKNTNLKKYGSEWQISSDIQKEKIKKIITNKNFILLQEKYPDLNIIKLKNNIVTIKCDVCNQIYEISTSLIFLRKNRYKTNSCLFCNPINDKRSSYEKELYDILKPYIPDLKINNRNEIKPYELDLYSKEHNIAIEINGLYWHSELYKDKKYHLNKTKLCDEKDIRLIHIFEDDWLYKKDIILSKLYKLLNINILKINSNKTTVKVITNNESKKFLNNNHIQGYILSKINIALFYDNDIISIMSFDKTENPNYDIELLRFCDKNGVIVIDSEKKLFNYFIKNFNYKRILCYLKRDWEIRNNNICESLNFKFDKYTDPNFYWTKETKRYTNVNNALNENNFYKIFDSGNIKYTYKTKMKNI